MLLNEIKVKLAKMNFVCNCNSFGNIDYGIPITPYQCDYRTSTERALKHMPISDIQYYGLKDPFQGSGNPFLEIKDERNKSDYGNSYTEKYLKYAPRYPRPTLQSKMHYMRIVKEQMYKNPPKPRNFPTPEYKDNYTLPKPEVTEPYYNIDERATCQVSSIGKGEQPRIKLEERGLMKQLDPYISVNQMAHIPFKKDEVHFARTQPYTFYNTSENPRLKRIKIRKPLNDETKFKLAIESKIVPKLVFRVPYSGKKSEFKDKFIPPNVGKLLVRSMYSDVSFKDSLSGPPKSQDLVAPNMYCTEYCHIGTGRNVRTAINMEKPLMDHQFERTGCKHGE